MRYPVSLAAIFAVFVMSGMVAEHAAANDGIKTIESRYSVKETLNRLSAILTRKGIRVMARVNHAAGAKAAGLKLPPTELLIFGNPKLGTPLMQTNRLIGLELPMKVLAWEDAQGKVQLSYTSPATIKANFAISGHDNNFDEMSAALSQLTAAAAGQ